MQAGRQLRGTATSFLSLLYRQATSTATTRFNSTSNLFIARYTNRPSPTAADRLVPRSAFDPPQRNTWQRHRLQPQSEIQLRGKQKKILQVLEIVSRADASSLLLPLRLPLAAPFPRDTADSLLLLVSLGRHTSKRWQRTIREYRNADVRGTELKWPFDATRGALSITEAG